jgi:hypothetical protein
VVWVTAVLRPIAQPAHPGRKIPNALFQALGIVRLVHPIHSGRLPSILALEALVQPLGLKYQSHQGSEPQLRLGTHLLCETSQSCGHGHIPLCLGPCLPDSLSQTATPFAPPPLPGFNATMGGSDCRQPLLPSSLFRLLRECVGPSTPPAGLLRCAVPAARKAQPELPVRAFPPLGAHPWLTHHPNVRLEAAYDPGVALCTRQCVQSAVACWRLETIGQHQSGLFGTQHLHGRHYPLLLHLAFFRAYASPGLLPVPSARLDTRPVASGYLGGIPTRWMTRPCQDAPRYDPVAFARPLERSQRDSRVISGHRTN